MLLLGIDIGTSSIKVSVLDAKTSATLATAQYPEDTETAVIALQHGWAEQSPDMWWHHVQLAIKKANASGKYQAADISAIGIAYQMHGLVVVDKNQEVLRDSIIWCDSRAVEIGEKAFQAIGEKKALAHLLNSPGNFTASKLAWVKANEPSIYNRIDKIMLPGDFIAMKLTGVVSSSISSLSEGIFWDFKNNSLSADVLQQYGIDESILPKINPVFSVHGELKKEIAQELSLKPGIPVTYKAGDQPNNALSLNVLEPGEVAATAGTSGVIYGVSDALTYDPQSRVNTFAHVNYSGDKIRTGVLLCINGTGILNRWVKNNFANAISYAQMNAEAATVPVGSNPRSLAIDPTGSFAYVPNQFDNTVPVISTATNTVVATVGVGPGPLAIAFAVSDPLQSLLGQIQALIDAGTLTENQGDVLLNKIAHAIGSLDNSQTNAACGQLDSFINQINAFINNGSLTQAQGQTLIDAANAIRASNGC